MESHAFSCDLGVIIVTITIIVVLKLPLDAPPDLDTYYQIVLLKKASLVLSY